MKAIRVSIFEDKRIGNCSNNGISARFNEILLECEDGYVDVTGEEENLCRIEIVAGDHKCVRPVKKPDIGCVGWMSGGALVYSSDVRFKSEYPLCLHDRQETIEQSDILSR